MEEKIKDILRSLGADACGIAGVHLFCNAPEGFHPTDIFPECQSVVVFLKRLPNGLSKVSPRIAYYHANNQNLSQIDRITFDASVLIEALGCIAVPLPCDGPYEYWDEVRTQGRGILSMRHAAVLAGLGSLGKNTLLINKSLGNMCNIGALLIDKPLRSDPPAEKLCIKNCHLCIDSCPQSALDGESVNQKLCRQHAYGKTQRGFDVCNCNVCRVVCPMSQGVNE